MGHPPWLIKTQTNGTALVTDSVGRLIAVVAQGAPRITADSKHPFGFPIGEVNMDPYMTDREFSANLQLIACAPELLAALKEAAYHLDAAGIPLNEQFYELINRASPDQAPLLPLTKTKTNNIY